MLFLTRDNLVIANEINELFGNNDVMCVICTPEKHVNDDFLAKKDVFNRIVIFAMLGMILKANQCLLLV